MRDRKVMDRDFKGVWIPKQIWLSKELSAIEKMVLVEIDSLDREKGCYASNAHFSELFDITKQRVSQIIKSLESKKWIKSQLIREGKEVKKRVIKVLNKFDRGIKKIKGGYQENVKGNNTNEYINIINNIYKGFTVEETELFTEYFQLRKKLKLSNSDRVIKRLIKKYFEFGRHQEIIEKAITSSWKDFYPLKENRNEKSWANNQSTKNQKLEDSNQELFERARQLEREAEENRGGFSETVGVVTDALPATVI